jgi:hypothetical protein
VFPVVKKGTLSEMLVIQWSFDCHSVVKQSDQVKGRRGEREKGRKGEGEKGRKGEREKGRK